MRTDNGVFNSKKKNNIFNVPRKNCITHSLLNDNLAEHREFFINMLDPEIRSEIQRGMMNT